LNGYDQGSSNARSLPNINEVVKRIVSISTTETGLFSFAADVASQVAADSGGVRQVSYVAGHFDHDTVRYIRITNKDDTNHTTLVFRGESGAEFAVMLDAGDSFSYCCDTVDGNGVVNTMDAHSAAQSHTLEALRDVTAQANTASCDLEVFVASV
jgi:hypothetical protein